MYKCAFALMRTIHFQCWRWCCRWCIQNRILHLQDSLHTYLYHLTHTHTHTHSFHPHTYSQLPPTHTYSTWILLRRYRTIALSSSPTVHVMHARLVMWWSPSVWTVSNWRHALKKVRLCSIWICYTVHVYMYMPVQLNYVLVLLYKHCTLLTWGAPRVIVYLYVCLCLCILSLLTWMG